VLARYSNASIGTLDHWHRRMAYTKSRTKPPKASAPRTRPPRIIEGEADIRDGVRWLRRRCPTMRAVHDLTGHPPLRRLQPGFEGLARIVVGQQLSVASAAAIWARTVAACRPFEPQVLLALEDKDLAGVGLSRPKIRALKAVAAACAGSLDLDRLGAATEQEIHAALTDVVGIGPWTADVYIMFCLGRADGWASGDLALQIAAQQALGLRKRPDKSKLDGIAERWRPWRGVAARLLWAYYAARKAKKSAIPV
jgi:DNA-3-methyladenine glycosylase II